MAVLNQPHWETVSDKMRELLRYLGKQSVVSRFYLAGGTALALQLGHRRSVDLDFFSESDRVQEASHAEILDALAPLNPIPMEKAFGNLVLNIFGISVGFFSYGYSLVGGTMDAESVALASLADIGLMKLDALASRGSRKDFYDLYFIATHVSLAELWRLSEFKYPNFRDYPLMVSKYMVLFDNADRDFQPDLLISVEWDTVKNFFVEETKDLRRQWFGF
jgi:hypothetical protein